MTQDIKAKMDFKKNLKDVEQKIELQMFDPKGKKGNAAGGRIGFGSGGNGGAHSLLPEMHMLLSKSLGDTPLSSEERERLDYLIDATGYLDEFKAQGGLIHGYNTGGVSNLFRSR